MTSLRLLSVLDVLSSTPAHAKRLDLTALSPASPCHVVRNAGPLPLQ
ncbi:MAG: hypothetical protein OXH92_13845 [Bryobacterales bacterium]|nr:hypothetical protein [Bryobacterales bacterium]